MDMGWKTIEPLEQLLLEEWKPNKPIVITITFTLARDVNLKFLQNTFIPRLISHPRFASVPTRARSGLYRFEPVARFTPTSPTLVDHHVQIEQSIPESEPEKEQLRLFTSRLSEIMSTPLPLDRPLWKLHLFNSWSLHAAEVRRNTSTLVLRVHHAVADGVGLVKYFLSQLVDSHPLDSPLRLLVPQARYKNKNTAKPTNWDPNRPSFLRSALEAVEDFHRVNLKPWTPDPVSVFTKDPLQENNLCAMLPPRIFTVDVLKRAAKRLGITVNDLLFAAWTGATREYIKDQGEDPSIMKGMRCAMPYNRHHCMEFDMSDVSNRLALLPVTLPVNVEDRGMRVEKCADNMRRVKRSIQPTLMLQTMRQLMYMPTGVRRGLWNHVATASSCLFSNLAGPTERVRVGGVDVTAVYSFPPCNPHVAVNTGMLTYDGALFVSVSGDANRLAHPHKLVGFIYQELTSIIAMSEGDGT